MALADYYYRYYLPYKDVDGNQWRVRIFDREEDGSVERLTGTEDPVNIILEGDETLTSGVVGSECSISLYGRPSLGGSDLSQFFTYDETRFLVMVEWTTDNSNWNLYWKGFLFQDEYTEELTSEPYQVNLVALDTLGTDSSRLEELGYNTDSFPSAKDVLEKLIEDSKLEFELVENTGWAIDGGLPSGTSSFLEAIEQSLQAFLQEADHTWRFKTILETIDSIAKSMFCRVFQSEGKLFFASNARVSTPFGGGSPFQNVRSISSLARPLDGDVIVKDNSLMARHITSTRTTNISIATGSINALGNAGFERNEAGDTSIFNWFQGTNNQATIQASDEALADKSRTSLKTINNRVSDTDFDNFNTSTKNSTYTVASTTTYPVDIASYGAVFLRAPVARLKFAYFVNNTFDSVYDLRISLSTKKGDFSSPDVYYDFENQSWGESFNYGEFQAESTGEWEEIDLEVVFNSSWFEENRLASNVTIRLHTINYDTSLQDVEVFYDNFEFRLYTGITGVVLNQYINEDSKFYVVSGDNDDAKQSSSTDVNLDVGISIPDFPLITNSTLPAPWQLLAGKLLGSYRVKGSPLDFFKVYFGNSIPAFSFPRSLQSWLGRVRKQYDGQAKKVISGNIATRQEAGSSWKPISFNELLTLNYQELDDNGVLYTFVRFAFSTKNNSIDFEATRCVVPTQNDSIAPVG